MELGAYSWVIMVPEGKGQKGIKQGQVPHPTIELRLLPMMASGLREHDYQLTVSLGLDESEEIAQARNVRQWCMPDKLCPNLPITRASKLAHKST